MIKSQLIFLRMALLSGVCSDISMPFSCVFLIAPGVFFGVAIWAALRECGFVLATKASSIVITLIAVACIAAIIAGIVAERVTDIYFAEIATAKLATVGLATAGMTGAGIVSITLACVVPQLRSFVQIISTTLAGGVAGALYIALDVVFPFLSGSSTHTFSYLFLVVIPLWQITVAVVIGGFLPLPTVNGSSAVNPKQPTNRRINPKCVAPGLNPHAAIPPTHEVEMLNGRSSRLRRNQRGQSLVR